jgi:LacI family transcriptional regulator
MELTGGRVDRTRREKDGKLATITDIAKRAGVSIKTVSRVLNNEPYVRQHLRERVEEAALAMNYRPNQSARRLAGRRSFLVAHLYDNPNPAYIAGIQAGAARRCRDGGYHLVVEPIDAHLDDVQEAAERLVATLAPDGVVLTPPLTDNLRLLEAFIGHSTPLVRIAPAQQGHGIRIYTDEREAARALTQHLIDLGHRRIGIVRSHPEHIAAVERFEGYCDALAGAGLRVDEQLIAQGFFDSQSGIGAGRDLLRRLERPTAIFATNDAMAMGVMFAARELGIDVPSELSVAGFDDTPMSQVIWPALTTVRQPLEDMGWAAVDALLRGEATPFEYKLPFELKIRGSTVPPK